MRIGHNTSSPLPLILSALLAISLLLFPGCAPFHSSDIASMQTNPGKLSKAPVGKFYHLPRARLVIEGKQDESEGYAVTITRVLEADPGQRYLLEYRSNAFFSDDIKGFTVNEDGLLTKLALDTEDETLAGLNELAESAFMIYKGIHGVPESGILGGKPRPEPFRVTFDPLSAIEVHSAVKTAARSHVGLEVRVPTGLSDYEETPTQHLHRPDGIFYHPPTAVGVTLDFSRTAIAEVYHKTVTIPDPTVVATYAFKRSPFIKREQSLTLNNGEPAETLLKKPSQFKGFTSGFKSLATTFQSAMPEIIRIRVEKQEVKEQQRLERVQSVQESQTHSQQGSNSGGGQRNEPDLSSRASPGSQTTY